MLLIRKGTTAWNGLLKHLHYVYQTGWIMSSLELIGVWLHYTLQGRRFGFSFGRDTTTTPISTTNCKTATSRVQIPWSPQGSVTMEPPRVSHYGVPQGSVPCHLLFIVAFFISTATLMTLNSPPKLSPQPLTILISCLADLKYCMHQNQLP